MKEFMQRLKIIIVHAIMYLSLLTLMPLGFIFICSVDWLRLTVTVIFCSIFGLGLLIAICHGVYWLFIEPFRKGQSNDGL